MATSTKKVHLSRPSNVKRTMCGRTVNVDETTEPKKVSCKTCRNMYRVNKKWYSAAKRRQTLAAKNS